MTDPDEIVPKLLELKHKNQTRNLSAVMAQLRVIDSKRAEIARERLKLDQSESDARQLSLQNGYARYLQARSDALDQQAAQLREQAKTLQQSLKETMCSQSILDELSGM